MSEKLNKKVNEMATSPKSNASPATLWSWPGLPGSVGAQGATNPALQAWGPLGEYMTDADAAHHPVLGRAAPAQRPVLRAEGQGRAARAELRRRTGARCAHLRQAGQLPAGARQAAAGRGRSIRVKRPFVVVDPRAGHGPGIGGFKADSEIGVAMRAGHPCYFVGFTPEPMPGPDDRGHRATPRRPSWRRSSRCTPTPRASPASSATARPAGR